MSTAATQSPAVLAARERLAEGRRKLREQHDAGTPGIQLCAQLTELLDEVVLDLYESALADLGDRGVEEHIALVPHGGYGRRDVAPYSDVDLMLLFGQGFEEEAVPLARRFTQHIYDSGLQLGFSLRTPRQACQLAMEDSTVFTSLAESRFLRGSVRLFQRFVETFRRRSRRRAYSLISAIEAARSEEKSQFGDTVYLLRPNVKRTRGGLRDLQMIRWVGFARYGESDPEKLERLGALLKEDRQALLKAQEYLLHLRNEMHFHAGRSQDVLDKPEQLRLARQYGLQGAEGVRPVEEFMRQYFEHTGEVRYRVAHFVAGAKQRRTMLTLLEGLFGRRMDSDFHVGPVHISARGAAGLARVSGDLNEVLRLMRLANHFDKRIDHRTWQTIRQAMIEQPPEITAQAARSFLDLLSQPARLANLLQRLHQLRVLEKIIPPFAHARCLVQFNEYHKYTVDEHSLKAIEHAASLMRDDGPAGRAYRGIRDKRILHLAILMHDLGKGFADDHSDVGARLAAETARRLGLDESQTETLVFLVHKHLRMTHLAFRHDLNDESVIVDFAVEVGRLDRLQMLYVLTCSDLAAVGPGVLNSWKFELLTQLYKRTRWHLSGDSTGAGPPHEELLRGRKEVLQRVKDEDQAWWKRQLEALPWSALFDRPADLLVEELGRLKSLSRRDAQAWGRWVEPRQAVEYTIIAHEEIVPGIFHRLTGALSSTGHQILSAEIHTLEDGMALDRFYVQDLDFSGPPEEERLQQVGRALVSALLEPSEQPPRFRQVWRSGEDHARLSQLPTEVQIDNGTSTSHTIITVFSYDRLGLLYSISRSLYQLGLSVSFAKIGTYLDQVVDVFYVTDQHGRKIEDQATMDRIRQQVKSHVENVDDTVGSGLGASPGENADRRSGRTQT